MPFTVFYYNPNIAPDGEYRRRVEEQQRFIREGNGKLWPHPVSFLEGDYRPLDFYEAVRGLESEPEGGERCSVCFRLRLREAARMAAEGKYDFYCTSLSISPLKDAERLNRIGREEGEAAGVRFLPSDFKKKNGYLRSTRLSREYGLYRQNYCGCSFSKAEAEKAGRL